MNFIVNQHFFLKFEVIHVTIGFSLILNQHREESHHSYDADAYICI